MFLQVGVSGAFDLDQDGLGNDYGFLWCCSEEGIDVFIRVVVIYAMSKTSI